MKVTSSSIKINYTTSPFTISFNQGWSNGSFSDYGPKMLKIIYDDNKLKINSEEMIASKLSSFKGLTSNILERNDFFLREGNNLVLGNSFTKQKLLFTKRSCLYDLCVDIHNYSIVDSLIDSNYNNLLAKKVVLGNIADSSLINGIAKSYRVINEEIIDSLPGIFSSSSIFEKKYSWIGGNSKYTNYHSVLFCETNKELSVSKGQWGLISDSIPVAYIKKRISREEQKEYQNKIRGEFESELILFSNDNYDFLVSYKLQVECGSEDISNVKLWKAELDSFILLQELPDLPVLILDIENDNHLDILYKSQIEQDPNRFIFVEYPYYRLEGQDTLFNGCGC